MHLFRSDDDDNEFERRQCRRRWEDARQTVYWLLYENSILTAGADKTIVGRLHAIQCFKLLPTTTTENTAQFHLINILSLKASTSSERAWALLILTQPNPTNVFMRNLILFINYSLLLNILLYNISRETCEMVCIYSRIYIYVIMMMFNK